MMNKRQKKKKLKKMLSKAHIGIDTGSNQDYTIIYTVFPNTMAEKINSTFRRAILRGCMAAERENI